MVPTPGCLRVTIGLQASLKDGWCEKDGNCELSNTKDQKSKVQDGSPLLHFPSFLCLGECAFFEEVTMASRLERHEGMLALGSKFRDEDPYTFPQLPR